MASLPRGRPEQSRSLHTSRENPSPVMALAAALKRMSGATVVMYNHSLTMQDAPLGKERVTSVARSSINPLRDMCLACVVKNLQSGVVGPKLKLLPPEVTYQLIQTVRVRPSSLSRAR